MFDFGVLSLVLQYWPRDWLGRTSPNWPIFVSSGM